MNKIIESIGSIFNIGGNYYKREIDKILNKSIEQALREDFEKVNQDFRNALKRLPLHRAVEQR